MSLFILSKRLKIMNIFQLRLSMFTWKGFKNNYTSIALPNGPGEDAPTARGLANSESQQKKTKGPAKMACGDRERMGGGKDATNWDEEGYRSSILQEREIQSRTVFRTVFAPSQNPNPDLLLVASSDGSLAPYSISSCISSQVTIPSYLSPLPSNASPLNPFVFCFFFLLQPMRFNKNSYQQ